MTLDWEIESLESGVLYQTLARSDKVMTTGGKTRLALCQILGMDPRRTWNARAKFWTDRATYGMFWDEDSVGLRMAGFPGSGSVVIAVGPDTTAMRPWV